MPIKRDISCGYLILDEEDAEWFDYWPCVIQGTYSKYVRVERDGRRFRLSRFLADAPKGMVVDHINGDPQDNRRSNLRICTLQQNNWNSRARVRGLSRFKGVHKEKGKWRAKIMASGVRHHLGTFPNEDDAARAYDAKARELHGEFACLNFPDQSTGGVRSARLHEAHND